MSNIRLSIIIVSFNTRDITDQCLHSIYSADWKDAFEVIVVDNNSKDGSVEMIREKYPHVRLIANTDNKLFSIANNQGAKIAKGDYLLLLNSDTIVQGDNLQRMIDFFESLPKDVICVGPKILNPDKSLQSCGMPQWGNRFHQCVRLYGLDKILPLHIFWPILDRRPDVSHRTGWVSGSCMMMQREKYMEVGGLNENLVFYGEEPEFGYRTDRLGYKTIYYAGASIIHLGGVSTNSNQGRSYSFEKDMREYESLGRETVGFKEIIKITKRTRTSLKIKRLFYKNKDFIDERIRHESKVIEYFTNKLKSDDLTVS